MSDSPSQTISSLFQTDDFIGRHIGPDQKQIETMLSAIGAASLAALIDDTVPAQIRRQPMALAAARSEQDVLTNLKALASKNQVARSMIGCGYYDTFTPPVILRNVLENPGWYTAYTPYQPEIAQGRLEALLNFQQMIIDLTGLDLANASLLDEATAAAEAMALCKRAARKNQSNVFLADKDCHPQTLAVLKTRAEPMGLELKVVDVATAIGDTEAFGVLVQYPTSSGAIHDYREMVATANANNMMTVFATDLMALLQLTPPGEFGADVVIGSSQRFGVPMGFGGPHAAFFATSEKHKRSVPGRIIGVSVDTHGAPALRMAMQTREQHIRREKATSNICTSQALLAIMAVLYAIYHGPDKLKSISNRINVLTNFIYNSLKDNGVAFSHDSFFDTLHIPAAKTNEDCYRAALAAGINLRRFADGALGISVDETTSLEDTAALLGAFGISTTAADIAQKLDSGAFAAAGIPAELQRSSSYLTHPVFNTHHSETDMLRYMKQLESRDIALNHSMIALGSCTMKLNATAEMIPVTWPEFGRIHPFAPADQVTGYLELIDDLERQLVEITGYDKFSMQPNAGSQGEYAGLLAIKRYHESRDDHHRDLCLIPSSAHGTNPASAAMAGMRVQIVACDDKGNIDIADLQQKLEQSSEQIAAIMVTYPSTHGVFEDSIRDVCKMVHDHGGQVYVDGANMNALVGVAAPGEFGADVSHLNLHKTFCIPHGGGGPGMGPIGVGKHLAPFLPSHPVFPVEGLPVDNDTVSASTYGSAGILPISWTYITLMGGAGLTRATEVAILNANYIASRLGSYYPVLYTGAKGHVAHECIIDLRPLREASGITEEDIAKRLIDYGFHAPTMSFPVAGTLMIEPTESESLAELDRFCNAMISIRGEIDKVQSGEWPLDNNPLSKAPHTIADIISDDWNRPYSREIAAWPAPGSRNNKHWPPVNRIDNVYGDRNLMCACPPIESYT